jgi:hypothetical protein
LAIFNIRSGGEFEAKLKEACACLKLLVRNQITGTIYSLVMTLLISYILPREIFSTRILILALGFSCFQFLLEVENDIYKFFTLTIWLVILNCCKEGGKPGSVWLKLTYNSQ